MEYKNGDIITITVDGRPYETYIDDHGTQRFRIDSTHPLWDRYCGDIDNPGKGIEDLNQLCIAYLRNQFDQRTYMEFNMSLGYSVCGFCELSHFDHVRLVNPIWDESEDDVGNDSYLYANLSNKTLTLEDVLQQIAKREGISYTEAQAYFVDTCIG